MESANPVNDAIQAWKTAFKSGRDVIKADAALSPFQISSWKILQVLNLAQSVWSDVTGRDHDVSEAESEDEDEASHSQEEDGRLARVRFLDMVWRRTEKQPKLLAKLLWGAATDWDRLDVMEADEYEIGTFAEV